jgi:hypothetical protein
MTLTIIFSVAFTNGGIAVWTLSEILPFALPPMIGALNISKIMGGIAIYK